jgi:hypothetical protein
MGCEVLISRVNLCAMDEQLFAIIESERCWDECFADVSTEELQPVSIVEDGDGFRVEVYADGSYVGNADDGALL